MSNRYNKSTKSTDLYLRTFVKNLKLPRENVKKKFLKELIRRTNSSRKSRSVISLSKLIKFSLKDTTKSILTVSKILNDERISKTPKLKIFALNFSSSVKKKIIENGGQIFKLNEIKVDDFLNMKILFIRGKKF